MRSQEQYVHNRSYMSVDFREMIIVPLLRIYRFAVGGSSMLVDVAK